MEPSELLREVAAKLQALGIDYFTTGSMASIIFGEPRFTNDIDIVIRIRAEDASRFCDAFPDADFYVSREAAIEAATRHTQFNIIHPRSGLKIDFMVADASDFNHSRFARAIEIKISEGTRVRFASPEDVIIRKLQYFQEGKSQKHIEDIRGILRVSGSSIDQRYIQEWVERFELDEQWALAQSED